MLFWLFLNNQNGQCQLENLDIVLSFVYTLIDSKRYQKKFLNYDYLGSFVCKVLVNHPNLKRFQIDRRLKLLCYVISQFSN